MARGRSAGPVFNESSNNNNQANNTMTINSQRQCLSCAKHKSFTKSPAAPNARHSHNHHHHHHSHRHGVSYYSEDIASLRDDVADQSMSTLASQEPLDNFSQLELAVTNHQDGRGDYDFNNNDPCCCKNSNSVRKPSSSGRASSSGKKRSSQPRSSTDSYHNHSHHRRNEPSVQHRPNKA